jgi:hypothetical protein
MLLEFIGLPPSRKDIFAHPVHNKNSLFSTVLLPTEWRKPVALALSI